MDKGKLLAAADGKGHKSIATWWIIELVGAVACIMLGYWAANKYGYSLGGFSFSRGGVTTSVNKNEYYNIIIGIGVVCAVLCLIMAYLVHTRISRTVIEVYENVIEGSSVVPKFPLSFMLYGSISTLQLAEFQLKYDQISSVDVVDENTVIINAINVQHKIYAMNAREIRDAIVSQKNKGNG